VMSGKHRRASRGLPPLPEAIPAISSAMPPPSSADSTSPSGVAEARSEPARTNAGTQRRWLWIVVFVAVLWLVMKAVLFSHWVYTSDLFSLLQMSYSWMDGKPVLWENCFGQHARIHSYYAVLLFGPLTRFLGAYGLFVGYLALLASAVCVAIAGLKRPWWYLTFVFGPVSWWIFDDPVFGWHAELLMIPFGILYAEGIRRDRWWRWVAAACLCACREEGPVVAWAVFAAASLGRVRWRKFAAVTAGYTSVFLILWWKLYAGSHAHEVLARITWSGTPIWQWSCLVAPLLVGCFLARRRSALNVAIALLPIAFLTYVGGIQHYPDIYYGMSWGPRVAMAWAVGLAVMEIDLHHRTPRWYWSLVFLGWQLVVLYAIRDYRLFSRIWDSDQYRSYVSTTPEEKHFLRQVAEDMPGRYTIATNGDYFTVFHRQSVAWPARATVEHPDMIVCDTEKRVLFENGCLQRLSSSGMPTARVGGLLIGYSPDAAYLFRQAALPEREQFLRSK